MKTLKIDFCGFWGSFKKEKNLFVKILSKHFNVEISDNPDFVICSNRGNPFEYMKYDCVRIMFMGENMSVLIFWSFLTGIFAYPSDFILTMQNRGFLKSLISRQLKKFLKARNISAILFTDISLLTE